ncbi:FG-GAP repeat domain-containing protein [Tenacibaculum soleae]|nr:VCBS repeat-containing protein [Tenacibaculum soleae]
MKNIFIIMICIYTIISCSSTIQEDISDDNPIEDGDNIDNPFENNNDFNISSVCKIGESSYSSKPIDFDNDGDIDIISYENRNSFFLYRNDGNKIYNKELLKEYKTTNWASPCDNKTIATLEVGDIDNDGNLDIIFTSYVNCSAYSTDLSKVGWFKNLGNSFSDFNIIKSYSTKSDPRPHSYGISYSLVSSDFDNDGDIDFINNNMDLFINEGNSNFNIQSINGSSHFMELVDFENDGDMDILTIEGASANWTTGRTTLYINEGSNTFSKKQFSFNDESMLANEMRGSLGDLTDLNKDGYKDLIVGTSKPPSSDISNNQIRVPNVYILLSNNKSILDGGYQELRVELPIEEDIYLTTYDIVSIDVDNDSFKDIVFNTSAGLSILHNESQGVKWSNHDKYDKIGVVYYIKEGNYDSDNGMELFVGASKNGGSPVFGYYGAANIFSSNFCY